VLCDNSAREPLRRESDLDIFASVGFGSRGILLCSRDVVLGGCGR